MRLLHSALLSYLLLFSGCSSNDTNKTTNSTITTIKKNTSHVKEKGLNESNVLVCDSTKSFKGNWFEIKYPADFTPTPTQPVDSFNNYKFVETDEAYFLSPNNEVTFFVYSPQWNGNPQNYLNIKTNEVIISEKVRHDELENTNTYKWITIQNKKDNYFRSYYSKQTASTHLVFGIKYNNQENYNQFKPKYKAFKASLIQYTD